VRDDRVYFTHIPECIRKIEKNVQGGKSVFLDSDTLQDAVLRNCATIRPSISCPARAGRARLTN